MSMLSSAYILLQICPGHAPVICDEHVQRIRKEPYEYNGLK